MNNSLLIWLFACLLACLFVCLFVRLFVCLFGCLCAGLPLCSTCAAARSTGTTAPRRRATARWCVPGFPSAALARACASRPCECIVRPNRLALLSCDGCTVPMHACIHTCMHVYIQTCIHAYIPAYIYTYKHAYMQAYIHTYVHTYIHACMHLAYMHVTYIRTHVRTKLRRTTLLPQSAVSSWFAGRAGGLVAAVPRQRVRMGRTRLGARRAPARAVRG